MRRTWTEGGEVLLSGIVHARWSAEHQGAPRAAVAYRRREGTDAAGPSGPARPTLLRLTVLPPCSVGDAHHPQGRCGR